jgi:phage tail sheath protein FI
MKYVNVGRPFIFIEDTLDEDRLWVVFEPHAG